MALPYVYRRSFDYRAPPALWLLLRPDLNVTGTTASLTLAGIAATVTQGLGVAATEASLSLTTQAADASLALNATATTASLVLAGQAGSIAFLDATTYPFRDVPAKVPYVTPGVFRRGFTVRAARPPMVKPAQVTTGAIDANRATLELTTQAAVIDFAPQINLWVLQEAVRQALLRRQLVYRVPLDMRPWDTRFAQFTIPAGSLTTYTRDLTLTGQQSTTKLSKNVAAQVAALILARPSAAARLGKQIAATTAGITLATQAARVGTGLTAVGTTAAISLAGQQAAAKLGKDIAGTTSSLIISGLTASFGSNRAVAANVSVMVLTTQPTTTKLDQAVAAFTAALSLTTNQATAQLSTGIATTTAALTITGNLATAQIRRSIEAAFAELSLESQAALITGATAIVIQVGRRTLRVKARNSTVTVH